MAKTIEMKGFMSDKWHEQGNDVSNLIRLNRIAKDARQEKEIKSNTKDLENMLRILDEHTNTISITPTRLVVYGIRDLSQVYTDNVSTEGNFLVMHLTSTKLRESIAVKILYNIIRGNNDKVNQAFKKYVRITKGATIMKTLGISYSSLTEIRDNQFYLVYTPLDEKSIMCIPGQYVFSTLCRKLDMQCPKDPDILDIAYMAKRLNTAKEFSMIVRSNATGTKAIACMGADYTPMKQSEVLDVIALINARRKCIVSNWDVSHYETEVSVIFEDGILDESYAVGAKFSFTDMGRMSPSITPCVFYEDGEYPYGERTSMKMDSKFSKTALVDNFFKEHEKTLDEMKTLFDTIKQNYDYKVNAKEFLGRLLLAVSNANTCKSVFPKDEPIGTYSNYGSRKIKELLAREEEQFGPFPEEKIDVVDAIKIMLRLWPRHRDDEEEGDTARDRLHQSVSLGLMKIGGYKFKKKKKSEKKE